MGGAIGKHYEKDVIVLNGTDSLGKEYRRIQVNQKRIRGTASDLDVILKRAEDHVFENEELVTDRLVQGLMAHFSLTKVVRCNLLIDCFKAALTHGRSCWSANPDGRWRIVKGISTTES